MRLNKTSFVLGNAFGAIAVGVVVVACGGGSDNTTTSVLPTTSKIDASNVLVKRGDQLVSFKGGLVRVQAPSEPAFVLAENVSLQNTSNDLQSTNLQAALDKEIAVDISQNIVGIWDIENYSAVSGGCTNYPTGRVEIKADGTYEILSGTFGAARDEAQGTPSTGGTNFTCNAHHSRTYKVVGKGLYFNSLIVGSDIATPSPVSITEATANSMTLFGTITMSRLTRVVQRPISNIAPNTTAKVQLVAMSRE